MMEAIGFPLSEVHERWAGTFYIYYTHTHTHTHTHTYIYIRHGTAYKSKEKTRQGSRGPHRPPGGVEGRALCEGQGAVPPESVEFATI